jgi:hypothetical protein
LNFGTAHLEGVTTLGGCRLTEDAYCLEARLSSTLVWDLKSARRFLEDMLSPHTGAAKPAINPKAIPVAVSRDLSMRYAPARSILRTLPYLVGVSSKDQRASVQERR